MESRHKEPLMEKGGDGQNPLHKLGPFMERLDLTQMLFPAPNSLTRRVTTPIFNNSNFNIDFLLEMYEGQLVQEIACWRKTLETPGQAVFLPCKAFYLV